MIKHTLKNDSLHVSIENMDFSYRIPVKKIGNIIQWRIGEKGKTGIVIKNVSTWTLQLFTKEVTADKYITQFKSLVQEYAPDNSISWDETMIAVNAKNEYNVLVKANAAAEEKITDDEILAMLEEKFDIA